MNIKTFLNALNGLKFVLRGEKNFRIHLLLACVVCVAGFLFNLSRLEWMFVIFSVSLVLILEAINTVVEVLVDVLYPRFDIHAGRVKDIMSGCVLISALCSLIVGGIVFIPHLVVWVGVL